MKNIIVILLFVLAFTSHVFGQDRITLVESPAGTYSLRLQSTNEVNDLSLVGSGSSVINFFVPTGVTITANNWPEIGRFNPTFLEGNGCTGQPADNDFVQLEMNNDLNIGTIEGGGFYELFSFTAPSGMAIVFDGATPSCLVDNGFENFVLPRGGSTIVLTGTTILPVEISFLTATKEDKFSRLNWETSSEINNDFFDVERSADGKTFQKIGKVQGNGTTTEVQNYTFLDRTPEAGLNYYRLKQVDFNGEYEYTKTVTVDFRDGTEGDVKIFPNPAVDFVNIQLDRTYETINITNQLGQRVANIAANQFEDNSLKLNVAGYAPGVYYLEAQLGTEIVNKQFVKLK